MFSTKHFYGEPSKIRARYTLIDDKFSLCSVWQFYAGNKELYTTLGVLEWEPGDTLLQARYVG